MEYQPYSEITYIIARPYMYSSQLTTLKTNAR